MKEMEKWVISDMKEQMIEKKQIGNERNTEIQT